MKTAVGLDIGWKEIRAVELTEDFRVVRIGRVEVPRPVEGDESDVYAKKIRELFNNENFSKDNVIISLRGFPIIARTYTPPSESREVFEKWFVESIESLIPGTPIADVVYDYQILGTGQVLISFAKLVSVENRINILRTCDIIPAAIDPSSLALYYAFESHPLMKEKKNFAILDIGGYSTDLLIVKEGKPYISTEILIGVKDLSDKGHDKNFSEALSRNLENIFHHYKVKERFEIGNLLLVGAYPNLFDLMKDVNSETGIKTEIGDSFNLRNIKLPTKFDTQNNHPYTHALGLALKGLNGVKTINLMTPELKETYRIWRSNLRAKKFFQKNLSASGIILIIFFLLIGLAIKTNNKISKDVRDLNVKKNELSQIYEQEKELNNKFLKLHQLGSEPFFWSRALCNLGEAVPAGINLITVSTEMRLTAVGTRPERKTKIVIEGDARDKETVLVFVKNLEKNFKNIVLNNMKEEVRCEFKISLTP